MTLKFHKEIMHIPFIIVLYTYKISRRQVHASQYGLVAEVDVKG